MHIPRNFAPNDQLILVVVEEEQEEEEEVVVVVAVVVPKLLIPKEATPWVLGHQLPCPPPPPPLGACGQQLMANGAALKSGVCFGKSDRKVPHFPGPFL